jgi:hypothetical protein
MASAAEWCQLDTVRFVAEIENLNQLEGGAESLENLEFLGPPSIIIQELRILVNGVVVEQIQDMGRTIVTLNALTPIDTKIMNGMEALQMADPYGQDAAVAAGADAAHPAIISEKRIKSEKYLALIAGEKRAISFSLAPSGLFQSGYMFPLMHGSISIEMLLVSSPKDVVVSDLAADPANGVFQRRHSERWQVNQPRLCYSSNTLSSAAQGEFDQLISGKGIVLNIDTWTTLQQASASSLVCSSSDVLLT